MALANTCGTDVPSDGGDNTFSLQTWFRKQVNFYYGQIQLPKWPSFSLRSKPALLQHRCDAARAREPCVPLKVFSAPRQSGKKKRVKLVPRLNFVEFGVSKPFHFYT